MAKAVITKETFDIPCKVYGCNKRSVYKLGNPTGHPAMFYHLCDEHARDIVESLPEEIAPAPVELNIEEMEAIVDEHRTKLKAAEEEEESPKVTKAATTNTTTKKTITRKVTK